MTRFCMNFAKKTVLAIVLFGCLGGVLYSGGSGDNKPVSGAKTQNGFPAYLNTGDVYPIVKPGETVTLSVAVVYDGTRGGKTEDLWWWKFCEKKMNVKFNVEQIMDTAAVERKNLMFASGDLKDLMLNLGITTNDLVAYGQSEKLLYDINKMMVPELAHNLLEMTKMFPTLKASMTCPDGGMYTFPKIELQNDQSKLPFVQVNKEWLDHVGLKFPETLEDMYNALKTFKEKDPSGTGKIVPLGGSIKLNDPTPFILNAMGFSTAGTATAPALKDGKVEIPCGSPLYREYLAYMNKLYSEKLIDENFFTMDNVQVNAQLMEKRVGFIRGHTQFPKPEDFQKYVAIPPVTSKWSSKKICPTPPGFTVGTAVMSAKTKYPEVAMRYMDYYFSKEGTVYTWSGAPATKPEDTLGMYKGWTLTEDNITTYPDVEEGRYRDSNTIKHNIITPVSTTMGNRSMAQDDTRIVYGLKPIGGWTWNDYTRGDNWFRTHVKDKVWPYLADSYPGTIYLPVDVNTRLSDLGTVINDYVSKESAKFITGANSLSNIDKYYSDLDALGFKEYQDIYINAYGTYQANLKK